MRDAIDLKSATVYNSPTDVANWPATTELSSLAFNPPGVLGIVPTFSALDSWPDVRPEGYQGDIRYTLWIGMMIAGSWHVSGPIEFWRNRGRGTGGDADAGGDILSNDQIAKNWTYDCGPMARQPQPGEQVAFFVTAGDQRKRDTFKVRARSNVVLVSWPTAAHTFDFPVDPTSVPEPTPATPPATAPDLTVLVGPLESIVKLLSEQGDVLRDIKAQGVANADALSKVESKLAAFDAIAAHMQEGVDKIVAVAAEVKSQQQQVSGVAEVQHNTAQKVGQVASDLMPLIGFLSAVRNFTK